MSLQKHLHKKYCQVREVTYEIYLLQKYPQELGYYYICGIYIYYFMSNMIPDGQYFHMTFLYENMPQTSYFSI